MPKTVEESFEMKISSKMGQIPTMEPSTLEVGWVEDMLSLLHALDVIGL